MAAQICSDVSYYSTTKNASGFVRDFFKPDGDIFAILIDAGAVYGNVAPEQSAFSVSTLPRKGPHCRQNVAAPDGIAHEHNIVIRHIVHIRSWPIMLIIAISAPVFIALFASLAALLSVLFFSFPDFLVHPERRPCLGPSRVEGRVSKNLGDFFFRYAVFPGAHQVILKGRVHQPLRHQRRHRHDGTVAQGQLVLAAPNLANSTSSFNSANFGANSPSASRPAVCFTAIDVSSFYSAV